MAEQRPYIPAFPYLGNQVIITSGRVTLHSKEDSVMMFGKKAIALTSLGTLNIDSVDRVIINAPIVELGLSAKEKGQPVLLGNDLLLLVNRVMNVLVPLGDALTKLSESKLEDAIPDIVKASTRVSEECAAVNRSLQDTLSKVTFTL